LKQFIASGLDTGFSSGRVMPTPTLKPVTQLLYEWRAGNQEALNQLMPLVYDELRRLAGHYMKSERPSHTLQPTALINEAYIRLVEMEVSWQDRSHFFAVAARLLRRILVDHAKGHRRDKRGGGQVRVTLDEELGASGPDPDILGLDEAITRLAAFDERKARVIEMHFFGGLTYEEMAEALGISQATVHRELRLAKAWLHHELTKKGGADER
jgi:RNA polymerase sigma factor (TIGR02999 family)